MGVSGNYHCILYGKVLYTMTISQETCLNSYTSITYEDGEVCGRTCFILFSAIPKSPENIGDFFYWIDMKFFEDF
jgi:hypothetical protein